jgi:transglutaminase-like putative cysteine protease
MMNESQKRGVSGGTDDISGRYLLEFPWSQDEILKLLEEHSIHADEAALRKWEDAGDLEYMWIGGERRYFKRAHLNLFRINEALREKKQIDRERNESLMTICTREASKVIRLTGEAGFGTLVNPQVMKVKFSITVDANLVPEREIVRCWMPYPVESGKRQDMVRMTKAYPLKYTIAPGDAMHRCIFFEQAAVKNEPVRFEAEFEFRSWSLHFDPGLLTDHRNIEYPCYVSEYLQERLPHISFGEEISALARSLVTRGMSQVEKALTFYKWINENIIWTSALEYGLMPDIPGYVLKNRRGDCGMQTLLFLSLCRYSGIPARWQSGWMMHPGHVNLHDWCEIYYNSAGWVPADVSLKLLPSDDSRLSRFYLSGIDSYRLIVNNDYGRELYPPKEFPRSEPVDFQRGEVEWAGGNIYFDKWKYNMEVTYM